MDNRFCVITRRVKLLLLLPFLCLSAWADRRRPLIEVLPTPTYETGLEVTSADARALAMEWMRVRGPVRLATQPTVTRPIARRITDNLELDLLEQLIRFVQGFGGDSSEGVLGDFRARYLREISARAPGFAWVVIADQIGFDQQGAYEGRRTGGAVGVQIPVLGERSLVLQDNAGQAVLRLMPLGGNYEQISVRDSEGNMVDAPGNGIVIRPTVEVEGRYRDGPWEPGARLLVQPRIGTPWGEVRMVAEVYLKFQIDRHGGEILRGTRIVPRCLLDTSFIPGGRSDITDPFSRSLFQLTDRNLSCSMNMEFAFDW
jgi:hypothetical protein